MTSITKWLKVFQLDRVSLVLACVISLLFTKGVVEFLGNPSKNTEHSSASIYSQQVESNTEKLILQADHHVQSPLENSNNSDSNSIVPPRQFKTLRHYALVAPEIDQYIFKVTDWHLEQSFKNTQPLRWSPTLFIAHRSLII